MKPVMQAVRLYGGEGGGGGRWRVDGGGPLAPASASMDVKVPRRLSPERAGGLPPERGARGAGLPRPPAGGMDWGRGGKRL
eukprot:gene14834-biopygen20137